MTTDSAHQITPQQAQETLTLSNQLYADCVSRTLQVRNKAAAGVQLGRLCQHITDKANKLAPALSVASSTKNFPEEPLLNFVRYLSIAIELSQQFQPTQQHTKFLDPVRSLIERLPPHTQDKLRTMYAQQFATNPTITSDRRTRNSTYVHTYLKEIAGTVKTETFDYDGLQLVLKDGWTPDKDDSYDTLCNPQPGMLEQLHDDISTALHHHTSTLDKANLEQTASLYYPDQKARDEYVAGLLQEDARKKHAKTQHHLRKVADTLSANRDSLTCILDHLHENRPKASGLRKELVKCFARIRHIAHFLGNQQLADAIAPFYPPRTNLEYMLRPPSDPEFERIREDMLVIAKKALERVEQEPAAHRFDESSGHEARKNYFIELRDHIIDLKPNDPQAMQALQKMIDNPDKAVRQHHGLFSNILTALRECLGNLGKYLFKTEGESAINKINIIATSTPADEKIAQDIQAAVGTPRHSTTHSPGSSGG